MVWNGRPIQKNMYPLEKGGGMYKSGYKYI